MAKVKSTTKNRWKCWALKYVSKFDDGKNINLFSNNHQLIIEILLTLERDVIQVGKFFPDAQHIYELSATFTPKKIITF